MGTLFRRARSGNRSNWVAEYTDHVGHRIQKSTRTANKKVAERILAHWEVEEAKRSSGLIDPRLERIADQAARPINEHLKEFLNALRSAGRSSVHVDRTKRRIETIVAHAGWVDVGAITPESVERFTAALQDQDRSNQTISHYMQAIKQFSRWLTRTHRLALNPLETITKPNPKADRRRIRRMLLPDEWPWLKKAAGERAVIYEVAIQTGLRSSEIRSVHPSHIKHASKPPHILVRSGSTKNNEMACQYITGKLARQLARRRAAASDTFFDLPDEHYVADMLRDDLAIARNRWAKANQDIADESDFLEPLNQAGERLDFHALRHTCGAWLAMKNIHPKTIQTIMRHKTITLTMDTYGHLFPNAEPEAVDQLGKLLSKSQ